MHKNKKDEKNFEFSEELSRHGSMEKEDAGRLSSDEEFETNLNPDDYE